MMSDRERHDILVEDVEDTLLSDTFSSSLDFYRKLGGLRMDVWRDGQVAESYRVKIQLIPTEVAF